MKCRYCKHNTLREEDGEQFTWCDVVNDNLDVDEDRVCANYRAGTNADRIRAMTDEELADFMIGVAQRGGIPLNGKPIRWLDWLKQEATT